MQTEYIWIDNTGKMVNFEAVRHQRDAQGRLNPNGLNAEQLVELGYQEVVVNTRPDDYSEKLYYRTEQSEAPYVIYTRKSDEQIAQMHAAEIEEKKKRVREARERVINRLNGIAGHGERRNKQTVAAACDAAVESLLAITDDLPTDPALVDGVILQRWQLAAAALAAAAPEAVSAFDRVDL